MPKNLRESILVDKNNNGGLENDGFDYDSLVEESLKNVVKKVLKITSETGLKGNSHFFISFNGNDPNVIVPPELKNNDNPEIKIIIQHQFWDLKTTDEHFEVTLSFNGQKKNVLIPFRSISSFTDPSVGFGLQFKIDNNYKISSKNIENEKIQSSQISSIGLNEENKSGQIVSLDEFRDKK